ncbi:MAG: TRL-like family protein [Xanthomonadaceae bacterium]|nr:TRL-like family protein [Xanthomonadaceae bacterium]
MKNLFAIALISVGMTGCATSMFNKGGIGFIYTDAKDSHMATSAQGARVGKACQQNILGAVVTGDSSIEAAKKEGGIRTVAAVDNEFSSIMGVYSKYCTIVTGN